MVGGFPLTTMGFKDPTVPWLLPSRTKEDKQWGVSMSFREREGRGSGKEFRQSEAMTSTETSMPMTSVQCPQVWRNGEK